MDSAWIATDEQADDFLSSYPVMRRLVLRKVRGGWVAVIDGSDVRPLPHSPMTKRQLQLTLAHRYLASVNGDCAYVNLLWARRLPNWGFWRAARRELAHAISLAQQEVSDA